MADLKTRFDMEEVRSITAATIGATAAYTAVGTPTENPAIQFMIQNLTDETVMFSWDGLADMFVLPARGYWIEDITANQQVNRGGRLQLGSTLYVQRITPPTTGSVYFSICYFK